MRRLNDLSLGIKLTLLLLLVLSLLLFSTVALLSVNTENLTTEVGSEQIAAEVNIIQSRLAEVKDEISLDINFLISDITFFQAVGRRDPASVSDIISRTNLVSGIYDVNIVDGDGNSLVRVGDERSDTAANATIEQALDGNRITTILITTPDSNADGAAVEVSIAEAAPIVSVTGNRLGAIQIHRQIDPEFLSFLTFDRARIYLNLIYDGRIIVQNTSDNPIPRNINLDSEAITSAGVGQTSFVDGLLTINTLPYAAAYIPLTFDEVATQAADPATDDAANAVVSPATMMILVELSELDSFQNTTLVNTIIVFIGLAILTVGLIYIIFYQIALKPIDRLRAITLTMTGGQYDQRIPVTTQDELGQLGLTFNTMAEAVQQREVSLQAARETAERSDHVKSAFLASMSHELRTPLNAVINFTKFVAKGSMGPVNEEQVETLNEVIDSARHLLNLINDVLDMSKIEAGSLTLFVEENINIVPLVESAVKTGKSLAKEKPIEFQVEIADDIPLIRGDRQRILQILLNITSNACKFTDKGYIRLDLSKNGKEEIVLGISDTGPGIAPEDLPAVFEAFKQTETGLRQAGGTGLGMPITKSLVEAHGGRIWIESTVGAGATFFVVLPIKSDSLETSLIM